MVDEVVRLIQQIPLLDISLYIAVDSFASLPEAGWIVEKVPGRDAKPLSEAFLSQIEALRERFVIDILVDICPQAIYRAPKQQSSGGIQSKAEEQGLQSTTPELGICNRRLSTCSRK